MPLHSRTHPGLDVDGCFGCHLASVQIATTGAAQAGDQADSSLARDRDAYKRLRADGLQPPRIDGAATLEARAEIAEQVESGHLEWEPSRVRQAEDLLGRKVTTPNTEGSAWQA